MSYGLPYKGSKNKIAKRLIEHLPATETFVDLFFGGGAVTHAAMLSGKYHSFIANDINSALIPFFRDAAAGKYHNEQRWVSHEAYAQLYEADPLVRYCFSYGCGGKCYIYGRAIEPYKRAMHYAIMLGNFSELRRLCPEIAPAAEQTLQNITDIQTRRLELGRSIVRSLKAIGSPALEKSNPLYASVKWQKYTRAVKQENITYLGRVQSLATIGRARNLQDYATDYSRVPVPRGATVYADPPYKGTDPYDSGKFDSERFCEWLRSVPFPVYVSEYQMPPDFVSIAEESKSVVINSKSRKMVTEKLFLHERWAVK